MKKIITALVLMIVIFGCSKKVTGNKSKTVETPPIVTPPKKAESKVAITPTVKVEATDPGVPQSPMEGDMKEVKPAEDKKKMILIATGKEVYSVKCSKCHELVDPKKYVEAKWDKLVDWMAPRAKLEANDKEAVLAYVKANAKK